MRNPWLNQEIEIFGRIQKFGPASAEDRKKALKHFNADKLRTIIAWPGTQRTVRVRAQTYLER